MTRTTPPLAGPAHMRPVRDPVLLSEVEQFLYHEAHLLDSWQLDEWLALMHPEVRERSVVAGEYERLGRNDFAERLRAKAEVLSRYLSPAL